MSTQNVQLPYLPINTIVPIPQEILTGELSTFIQYLTRLYEDIAINVNARDFIFFPIPISDVPTDIPNVSRFGAFMICVSAQNAITIAGQNEYPPCGVWALSKSDPTQAGVVNQLSFQAGTGANWGGIVLTITSTATNFQIAHNLASTTAGFNIRIIGTQL